MKVTNPEWISFKEEFVSLLSVFEKETDKFSFPIEDKQDFIIMVDNKKVIPVFVKKENFLRVEYDLSLCNTKVKRFAFSKSYDSLRVEVSLKN